MIAQMDSLAFAERFRFWRTELADVSLRDLADQANEHLEEHQRVTHRTLSNYERQRPDAPHHGPRVEHILAIHAAHPNLNLRWLFTGEGPPVTATGLPELAWLGDREEALPVLDGLLRRTADVTDVPLTARYLVLRAGALPVAERGSATVTDVADAVALCGELLGLVRTATAWLSPEHGKQGGRPDGSFLVQLARLVAQKVEADGPNLDRWQLRCLRTLLEERCTICGYRGSEALTLVTLEPGSEPPLSRTCLMCPSCHQAFHGREVAGLRRLTTGMRERMLRLTGEQVARLEGEAKPKRRNAADATDEDPLEEVLDRAARWLVTGGAPDSDGDPEHVP